MVNYMKKVKLHAVALLVVAGLLLSACGGGAVTNEGGPPAGWERFEGEGFEVYLPESYEGGGRPEDLAAVAQTLREAGNETMAQAVESSQDYILLYVVDTEISNEFDFYTNVNVIREQNSAINDITIEDYADLTISQLEGFGGIIIVESGTVNVPGFDAWRITEELDAASLFGAEGKLSNVQYLLKKGDTVWVLTYTTESSEFDTRLPIFEQSVLTFAVR
jgi:hypothetical protein